MDNPKLIEQYEIELQQLIARMHSDNLRYDVIWFLFVKAVGNLGLQGQAENWLDNVPKDLNVSITPDSFTSE